MIADGVLKWFLNQILWNQILAINDFDIQHTANRPNSLASGPLLIDWLIDTVLGYNISKFSESLIKTIHTCCPAYCQHGLSTIHTHPARLAPNTCVCGVHKQKNRPHSEVALHNTFTCPNYWIGLRRYAQTSHFFIIKNIQNPKVPALHLIFPLWTIWYCACS